MKIFKKRSIAILICVLAVIGSVLVSTHRELGDKVDEVKSQFVDGVNHDGESIYNDLQMSIGLANNLAAVAKRYLPADSKEIKDVESCADDLGEVIKPKKAYAFYSDLDSAVQLLNLALQKEELSDTDENYRSGIMTDFASYSYSISHDGYNSSVRELRENEIGKFPASILSRLAFVGSVDYFN